MIPEASKSPYPWFGGKSTVAPEIWRRLGDVGNFIDPFLGSNAVLLGRPQWNWQTGDWRDGKNRIETVNDADGTVSNFWRAISADPEQTAHYADWPVNENDLHARHAWLVGRKQGLTERLEGDPDYYDAKIAGFWCWGVCCWIGSGFCSGNGPWHVEDGRLVDGGAGQGVKRVRPHLGNAGQGVNRQLPHLGAGRGVNRQRPHLGAGRGVNRQVGIYAWFAALSARLRRVRVCCGDWSRVMGLTPTFLHGLTGIILDPPYAGELRGKDLYDTDSDDIAVAVRQWALENGDNPLLRIALAGYVGEHDMPGWTTYRWKAHGGYGVQGDGRGRANAELETIWFNKSCLAPDRNTVRDYLRCRQN